MSVPTEPTTRKCYAFDLKAVAKNCPGAIDFFWDDAHGVQYELCEDFCTLTCGFSEIKDGRLLIDKEAVEIHSLIWDHVYLDNIYNDFLKSKDLPDHIRQKMTTGYFGDLTGSDFYDIPYKLRRTTYESFKTHNLSLTPSNLDEAFFSSYLFAWAKAQVKAGKFKEGRCQFN